MDSINITIKNTGTEALTARLFDRTFYHQNLQINYDLPEGLDVYEYLRHKPTLFNSIGLSSTNIENYYEALTVIDQNVKNGGWDKRYIIPAYYLSPFQSHSGAVQFNKQIVLKPNRVFEITTEPQSRVILSFMLKKAHPNQHILPFEYMYPMIVENKTAALQKVKLFSSETGSPSVGLPERGGIDIKFPYAPYSEIQNRIANRVKNKECGYDKEFPLVFSGMKAVCGNFKQLQTNVTTATPTSSIAVNLQQYHHPAQNLMTVIDAPFGFEHKYTDKDFVEIELLPFTKAIYMFYKAK